MTQLQVLPTVAVATLVLSLAGVGSAQSAATDGHSAPVAQRPTAADGIRGWLSWRGPRQDGTSPETGLPDRVELTGADQWTEPLAGRGTPVIANGRVYTLGYAGEGAELQELLVCLDERTGERIWEHRFTDFLTDIIYYRFSIGSPTIDPGTGNVLCMSSAGLLSCFTADGERIWQRCMMSEYGRLTFPNGRTGAPLVDGDLAIVHVISSAWGAHAPARDRFYAFDKRTGESIWSSTPGGPPKDSSFSFPVVATENGRRVLYAGLGGGHLVCVDVRTGDPIWRFAMATGGASSSVLLYGDSVIAVHGKENVDDSRIGRMVAVTRGAAPPPGAPPKDLDRSHELWRNDLTAFTSSPVLVGDRVYQTVATGDLCCVDAATGAVLWHHKLAPDQLHASPVWGDGKLYVPMNNGMLFIVRPTDEGAKVLQEVQLEGNCLGAPAIAAGRVYVHTTAKLYCFGRGTNAAPAAPKAVEAAGIGPPTRLQVIPADFVVQQGDALPFRVRSLDANGRVVADAVPDVTFTGLPARSVSIDAGRIAIAADAAPTATVVAAAKGDLRGATRLRIVPRVPFADDFEDADLSDPSSRTAPARPYWVGAMKKWEILDLDGQKVLARTLDNPLFQRTMSFIGHPDMSGYTTSVDIRTDGNRRSMSSAGVVNQRYLIMLKGNHQELEVSSNMELLKESVRFRWRPGVWYRLVTRVDVDADGSGWIRAKAWPRDAAEPDDWTIEVRHSHAHGHGSPGLYGFTPQSRFRVYLDNVSVTPND